MGVLPLEGFCLGEELGKGRRIKQEDVDFPLGKKIVPKHDPAS